MPDITMCVNKQCPLGDECYRFMAQPKPQNQSFAFFHSYLDEEDIQWKCNHFIPIKEKDKL